MLTVREKQPNSHANKGWEQLTDQIIKLLDQRKQPIVFMLWGKHAQSKKTLIQNPNHLILCCSHPSPYSASYGFFGCHHFSKANQFLLTHHQPPIDWQIR